MGQVSAIPEHFFDVDVTMSQRSLNAHELTSERFVVSMVGHYFEQWLVVRISAPQGMEANLVGAQIDLAAHQPMRPLAGDLKALAHQVGPSSVVGATQEDDRAAQRSVRIELEALRKGSAWRGLLPAARTACAVGGDVACIDGQKLREVFETMPLPDLGLPQCVEAFNGILKSRLARGREYRVLPPAPGTVG